MNAELPTQPVLGCIADDYTGATDLANNLVQAGMRVSMCFGLPKPGAVTDTDAVVVALKSRTIAVSEAVAQSLTALAYLKQIGARQIYFKYCSTFDSTAVGNIGPVLDALMLALNAPQTIATPALPVSGRTVFNGNLFVNGVPLNESSMRNHPLTPMTDANLVRVLQSQSKNKVGLANYQVVRSGASVLRAHLGKLHTTQVGAVIVDAIDDADLLMVGEAVKDFALVTGGSGLAAGIARNFGFVAGQQAVHLSPQGGASVPSAIVCGSCSERSNEQVAHAIASGLPSFRVEPHLALNDAALVAQALDWVAPLVRAGQPVLIYSTAEPANVAQAQAQFGRDDTATAIEACLGRIAAGLVSAGVRRLVLAGGETSGACVQAIGVSQMRVGPQIDPGVPWCETTSSPHLQIALKSGNFGSVDFFTKALGIAA